MKTLPLWPDHLPKVPFPNIITLGFHQMSLGGHRHLVYSTIPHTAAKESAPKCPPEYAMPWLPPLQCLPSASGPRAVLRMTCEGLGLHPSSPISAISPGPLLSTHADPGSSNSCLLLQRVFPLPPQLPHYLLLSLQPHHKHFLGEP